MRPSRSSVRRGTSCFFPTVGTPEFMVYVFDTSSKRFENAIAGDHLPAIQFYVRRRIKIELAAVFDSGSRDSSFLICARICGAIEYARFEAARRCDFSNLPTFRGLLLRPPGRRPSLPHGCGRTKTDLPRRRRRVSGERATDGEPRPPSAAWMRARGGRAATDGRDGRGAARGPLYRLTFHCEREAGRAKRPKGARKLARPPRRREDALRGHTLSIFEHDAEHNAGFTYISAFDAISHIY